MMGGFARLGLSSKLYNGCRGEKLGVAATPVAAVVAVSLTVFGNAPANGVASNPQVEWGVRDMRAVHKRYLVELFGGMLVYLLLLLVSVLLLRRGLVEQVYWRALLALLPVLPVAWVIRALVRVIRGQDELERRIDLESVAVAAALTGFGFFTFGLLLAAQVMPAPAAASVATWVLPALFGTFGLAKCLLVAPFYRRA